MTDDELVRKTVLLNYEIIITHGLTDGGVGFEWQGLFIHNPFADPQYGAFAVDPVQRYGDAYMESIFATDPVKALELAQQQLRDNASGDLSRYRTDHGLNDDGVIAIIDAACGVRVPNSANPLEALTNEQVVLVWAHVDETVSGKARIECSVQLNPCRQILITPMWTTFEQAIERSKLEILGDVAEGTVPPTCASYSELHDYVDANGYGGAFEHDFENEETDFWNAVQDAVDVWIKAGGLKL